MSSSAHLHLHIITCMSSSINHRLCVIVCVSSSINHRLHVIVYQSLSINHHLYVVVCMLLSINHHPRVIICISSSIILNFRVEAVPASPEQDEPVFRILFHHPTSSLSSSPIFQNCEPGLLVSLFTNKLREQNFMQEIFNGVTNKSVKHNRMPEILNGVTNKLARVDFALIN